MLRTKNEIARDLLLLAKELHESGRMTNDHAYFSIDPESENPPGTPPVSVVVVVSEELCRLLGKPGGVTITIEDDAPIKCSI